MSDIGEQQRTASPRFRHDTQTVPLRHRVDQSSIDHRVLNGFASHPNTATSTTTSLLPIVNGSSEAVSFTTLSGQTLQQHNEHQRNFTDPQNHREITELLEQRTLAASPSQSHHDSTLNAINTSFQLNTLANCHANPFYKFLDTPLSNDMTATREHYKTSSIQVEVELELEMEYDGRYLTASEDLLNTGISLDRHSYVNAVGYDDVGVARDYLDGLGAQFDFHPWVSG